MKPEKQENTGIRDETGKFVKGKSGNPDGRPKGRTITEELKKILSEMKDDEGNDGFTQIAKMVIDKVSDDNSLLRDLIDRIDGKAKQAMEIEHSGTGQLVIIRNGDNLTTKTG